MVHIRHTKLLVQWLLSPEEFGLCCEDCACSLFFETHQRHLSLYITISRSMNSQKPTGVSSQVKTDSFLPPHFHISASRAA